MNLTEMIISRMMEKKAAADELVSPLYKTERTTAWYRQPKNDRLFAGLTPGGKGSAPFWGLYNEKVKSLPILRAIQATNQAAGFTTPGSDAYNMLRKYLIEHGETNWHNFNNPKNPRPNPKVPEIKDDAGKLIDPNRIKAAGRTMVDNSNNNRFGNIG